MLRARASQPLTRAAAVLTLVALATVVKAEEVYTERCNEENAAELLAEPIAGFVASEDDGSDSDSSEAGEIAEESPEPSQPVADPPEPTEAEEPSTDGYLPERWEPTKGRGCHRYLGRNVCEGPRKIPLAHGLAAERAREFGLGTPRASSLLQGKAIPREWVHAVEGVAKNTLRWPVDEGRFWRPYGNLVHRGRRRLHKGVDIGAPAGTIIRSVNDGLVGYSDNKISGYGNMMIIVHADSSVAFYAHCKANYVFAGQMVRRGQPIGEVGATGLAYGAHLHFELRVNGKAIDPMPLFVEIPEKALWRRRNSTSSKR